MGSYVIKTENRAFCENKMPVGFIRAKWKQKVAY